MFKLVKTFIIIWLLNFCLINSYAQDIPRLCICFQEPNKLITLDISKDSIRTSFSIVKEGFETKEKREKAKKEWRENKFAPAEPPISFYYNFFSSNKPEKINSIKEVDDCVEIVEVDKYRRKDFKMPEGARSGLFIFIKKLDNGTYLKWNVMKMTTE